LRDRGGLNEVRRRSAGHPRHFLIAVDVQLEETTRAHYSIEIAAGKRASYIIRDERCSIGTGPLAVSYHIRDGELSSASFESRPSVSKDRLYLTKILSIPQFDKLHKYLTGLRFYDLDPGEIKELQPPDVGDALAFDGWNCASVWSTIESDHPDIKERLEDFLAQIAQGVTAVTSDFVGPKATLRFSQQVSGSEYPWNFFALNMSEGTLRAFGVLLALFQPSTEDNPIPFVAIEEPERGIHPAAMGVILDAIKVAAASRQIIATSHSPDLLDRPDIDSDSILAVTSIEGKTVIGPIDDSGRSVLRDRLYTVGELLRKNQLQPSPQ
jgi:predicted ATPase